MENEFCFVFSYLKKLRNPHTHTQTYLILITYGIICLGNFQLIFLLKKILIIFSHNAIGFIIWKLANDLNALSKGIATDL